MSWLDQLDVFYFMLFLTYDGFVRACNSMSIYTVCWKYVFLRSLFLTCPSVLCFSRSFMADVLDSVQL